jgi:hypothetical protein
MYRCDNWYLLYVLVDCRRDIQALVSLSAYFEMHGQKNTEVNYLQFRTSGVHLYLNFIDVRAIFNRSTFSYVTHINTLLYIYIYIYTYEYI